MVAPTLLHLSPERLEYLEQITDVVRLRVVLYLSPKPPTGRRSREYPSGRPNPWRAAHLRRHRHR
ncbi:hypothetical protein ACFC0M_32085 [Streptomyces sp. NPDC056149]|uniref:hypothetical protein n=1 Tax=Streptomyces sp. NPDC056149 TaxID=3345728 RepID=UPI0035D72CB8